MFLFNATSNFFFTHEEFKNQDIGYWMIVIIEFFSLTDLLHLNYLHQQAITTTTSH